MADERVIETTWSEAGSAYLGISIDLAQVARRHLAAGVSGSVHESDWRKATVSSYAVGSLSGLPRL